MAAAGSVAIATQQTFSRANYRQYRMPWTASSGGAVQEIPLTFDAGALITLDIVPNLSATQPTDLFDLTLLNADGLDVLGGRGANLSNASATRLVFDPPVPHAGGSLTPTITNAGDSKTGTLVLTIAA